MPDAWVPFLMFGGVATVFAFIAWQSGKASKVVRENAEALAARLGLHMDSAKPVLGRFYPAPRATGVVRGKRMELYTYTTGSGKSRKTWVALAVTPARDGGLTFSLSRQGLGSRVLSLFGAKEIQVGDPGFDERWFIQTNQPDFLRAALLPELRAKLSFLERSSQAGSLKLEKGVVSYVEGGTLYDRARCERFAGVADVVGDFADIAEVYAHQSPA